MKLSARDVAAYFKKPDAKKTGHLIFGADAMRVALRREQLVDALVGPKANDEMRLVRLSGADVRKDPAGLIDAIKERSFFDGPRLVFIEEAGDSIAKAVANAFEDWQPGDAPVLATAGALKASSSLRKIFEKSPNAYSIGIYDDPPSRQEIETELKSVGLNNIDQDAMQAIVALANTLDPGEFRQTIDRLSLYMLGEQAAVTTEDILQVMPSTTETVLDDVLCSVADMQDQKVAAMTGKLSSQGVQPVTLCISATRYFRTLFAAAANPGGAAVGVASIRPPVFGPRRDRIIRQAQNWGPVRLEAALQVLTETDLALRSVAKAPQRAVIERALIRLAIMGKR